MLSYVLALFSNMVSYYKNSLKIKNRLLKDNLSLQKDLTVDLDMNVDPGISVLLYHTLNGKQMSTKSYNLVYYFVICDFIMHITYIVLLWLKADVSVLLANGVSNNLGTD